MRRMFVSRSSLEKPSPLLRLSRTSSPSSVSTLKPASPSFRDSARARVVFPAPESPVSQMTCPCVFIVLYSPFVSTCFFKGTDPFNNGPAMKSAFGLALAGPPTRALIFANANGARAVRAPDARVALIVERVIGDFLSGDVIPDLPAAPFHQRVYFHDAPAVIPFDRLTPRARGRLVAPDGGHPGVVTAQSFFQRFE